MNKIPTIEDVLKFARIVNGINQVGITNFDDVIKPLGEIMGVKKLIVNETELNLAISFIISNNASPELAYNYIVKGMTPKELKEVEIYGVKLILKE